MSESTLFTFLFVATLPVGLMPCIISVFIRHKARLAVLASNLAIWGVVYFSVRSFFSSPSGFFLPIPIAALAWVGLFAYVLRSRRNPQAPLGSP